jgi:starch synthase
MNQFKIWYVASEIYPFAKTTVLGDVTGSFPKSLKAKNQEIRVIMPKYKTINERKYILREVIRLRDIPVTINGETKTVNVKSAFLPDSKVQIYFVEIPDYFGRVGLYTDHKTGKEYPDNVQRYAYFCKAALETLKILSWKPDIIHCNDWQTAFVPIYLKTIYQDDEFLRGIKTVFTIHDLVNQGIVKKNQGTSLDLALPTYEKTKSSEDEDSINILKEGINLSDWITTVSKTYAKQIFESDKYGYGLSKFLKARTSKFTGILNGVDYSVWTPQTDKFLPFQYAPDKIEIKEQNKHALMTRINLKYRENNPLIGIISQLSEEKGIALLLKDIKELLQLNVQFIILGMGDKKLEKELQDLQNKYPDKINFNSTFDETVVHMVVAGSDFILLPSAYEPCGMLQMYGMKYGTVPIVHKTGGLADTVTEIDFDKNRGNGFVFEKHTTRDLLRVVKLAIKLYKKTDQLKETRLRIMKEDFTWDSSTEQYLEIYNRIAQQDFSF